VSNTCTSGTQYFSVGACTVSVNAGVAFAGGLPNGAKNVYLVERTWDNAATPPAWVLSTKKSLNRPGTAGCPANAFCGDPVIGDSSGIHEFVINWEQTQGSITGLGTCNNQSTNPCTGSFGIEQQSFGACNGCDQPDDSGPVVFAQISEVNGTGLCAIRCDNQNSLAGGSTHQLVFTVKLSGLNTAAPGSPATVLRFAASTNHQTGLVDCGQGNSLNGDSEVVYYGCGPGNPNFTNPPLNPLFVYSRTNGTGCSPAIDGNTTGWPNGNNQDCVQTTPGQRRVGIICPLIERITGEAFGTTCTGSGAGTNCPANNWSNTLGSLNIPAGDPRAVTMIITSPADFASAGTAPQFWLPIRKFATFYVTGWDTKIKPSCTGAGPGKNEPYPVKGKQNSDNGAVWGHWINYEDTAGTPDGQLCVIGTSPTNCVPALTR
jgi:hypothetical protein